MNWWMQLDKTRGSRPRCVSMMDGDRASVARRLTHLVDLPDVHVTADAVWMPQGLPIETPDGTWDVRPADEAKLDRPNPVLPLKEQDQLRQWWLASAGTANTPNWDIASTCTVAGQLGLLLIEAKAHDNELRGEEKGKQLDMNASDDSFANHVQIGRVIADAAAAFQRSTARACAVSRDQRYQMSNRFASACKLTEMGYAVVLIYIGFLEADEMRDRGAPFSSHAQWRELVERHSSVLFAKDIWHQRWEVNGRPFIPLIRSIEHPMPSEADEIAPA